MQKDLKVGMALGLMLISAAAAWLSTRPGLSTEARMLQSHNRIPPQRVIQHPSPIINLPNTLTPVETNTGNKTSDSTLFYESEKIKTKKFHIVRKGETLWKISNTYYGSASKWQKIFVANRSVLESPDKLRPGMKLIIPP